MIQNGPRKRRAISFRPVKPVAVALTLVLGVGAVWVLATPGPLDRFGTLKGSDFAQFYTAARLAVTGRLSVLYDWTVFAAELRQSVPGPPDLLYLSVYPPQLALLLAPLGRLTYFQALGLWTVVSVILYGWAGWTVLRPAMARREERIAAGLLLSGFPAIHLALLNGQVSTLAAAVLALAWVFWKKGDLFAAGIALGSLAFKPPLLTVALAAALAVPAWRLWCGALVGAAVQVTAVWWTAGLGPWRAYIEAARRVLERPQAFEPKIEQMQSLRGFFELAVGRGAGTTALYALAAVGTLVLIRRLIQRRPPAAVSFAAVVIGGLLLDPHLYAYDLVVLVVPLGVLACWLLDQPGEGAAPGMAAAAWLLFWTPLVWPLTAAVRIQAATPAMLWLLWTLRGAPGPASARPGTVPPSRRAEDAAPSASRAAGPHS